MQNDNLRGWNDEKALNQLEILFNLLKLHTRCFFFLSWRVFQTWRECNKEKYKNFHLHSYRDLMFYVEKRRDFFFYGIKIQFCELSIYFIGTQGITTSERASGEKEKEKSLNWKNIFRHNTSSICKRVRVEYIIDGIEIVCE